MKRERKQQRTWTILEVVYIAKFFKFDGAESLAAAFDAKEKDIQFIFQKIKASGNYENYVGIWDRLHKKSLKGGE